MPTTDVFKKDLLIGKIAFVTGGNDCMLYIYLSSFELMNAIEFAGRWKRHMQRHDRSLIKARCKGFYYRQKVTILLDMIRNDLYTLPCEMLNKCN